MKMPFDWTKEQEAVINLRNRNILVSAAAGSGKTAVLVERILTMITEGDNPIDVDNLLVVTFTRAAAGEMKERILAALEKRLEVEPENEHLQRQTTFIHNAQINTIHGFCGYVIKNYFHLIGLDPGYRVAEEGELKLLKMAVVREVVEDAYQENEKDFLDFVEWYATGKRDDTIEGLILKLHEFAMSHPRPKKWLQECEASYQEEPEGSKWVAKMWADIKPYLAEALYLTKQSQRIAGEVDGPYMYEEALLMDEELINLLLSKDEYEDFAIVIRNREWTKLSAKADKSVSADKRKQIQNKRKEVKAIVGEIEKLYFYAGAKQVWENIQKCAPIVAVLIKLTIDFMTRFAAQKRKKNILDYADMEHLALDILTKEEGGELVPSDAAKELSSRFAEVLIDEYQDSNSVQEMLVSSVSKRSYEEHNIFMVGDVKQSIYRFRMAQPELFMDKYHKYTKTDSACQRIDLHKNFRSRKEVLDAVNYLFYRIMHETLGGVTYDQDAALNEGATFMPGNNDDFAKAEIMLIEKDSELLEADNVNAKELEARALANRIEAIVGHQEVFDKALNGYRPANYRDCVILLRTISGWGDIFARVLGDQGIPAYVTSRTGYFSAIEVVTVLNYLHICDNPKQEIPFTAILHSPIVGCNAEELAKIKGAYRNDSIYDACASYALEYDDDLAKKLNHFWEIFMQIRSKIPYTPIHELIRCILAITNYEQFVAAMPAGEQRRANIKMLIEKAKDFEQTSYRGLFNFIRYIEYLQKYKVDYGEVNVSSEQENTVRIMSVHQSKGLEFPIVLVAGMGKGFNLQDSKDVVILHPDYGIGTGYVDPHRRLKAPTLLKQVIRRQITAETLGEEMRVLYVALTRAKEKLIIAGTIGNLAKQVQKCADTLWREENQLSYVERIKAKNYWDWILPAVANSSSFAKLYQQYEIAYQVTAIDANTPIDINLVQVEDLVEKEVVRQVSHDVNKEFLLQMMDKEVVDEAQGKELSQRFSYLYPYQNQLELPVKVTVSELKADIKRLETEEGLAYEADIIPLIPRFIATKEVELTGAERGTAYHRVMECLDLLRTDSQAQIEEQLKELSKGGKIDEVTQAVVKARDIWQFVNSDLGQRMKRATANGLLHKEQSFVMSVAASEKDERFSSEDSILVQGIIDIFFYEDDGIIVADYKTDKVIKGKEDILAEKYGKQLGYYAEALERITGKTVTEKIIYSFTSAVEVVCK